MSSLGRCLGDDLIVKTGADVDEFLLKGSGLRREHTDGKADRPIPEQVQKMQNKSFERQIHTHKGLETSNATPEMERDVNVFGRLQLRCHQTILFKNCRTLKWTFLLGSGRAE